MWGAFVPTLGMGPTANNKETCSYMSLLLGAVSLAANVDCPRHHVSACGCGQRNCGIIAFLHFAVFPSLSGDSRITMNHSLISRFRSFIVVWHHQQHRVSHTCSIESTYAGNSASAWDSGSSNPVTNRGAHNFSSRTSFIDLDRPSTRATDESDCASTVSMAISAAYKRIMADGSSSDDESLYENFLYGSAVDTDAKSKVATDFNVSGFPSIS
ncbi:hypothetical protein EDD17DRAFT_1568092 [Pisolithus thermaeus]|nr:hypothetical protein EDD17DRAFT_1568092 [Pisolithus thermaeus]